MNLKFDQILYLGICILSQVVAELFILIMAGFNLSNLVVIQKRLVVVL
jgi:hypothetical protein